MYEVDIKAQVNSRASPDSFQRGARYTTFIRFGEGKGHQSVLWLQCLPTPTKDVNWHGCYTQNP
jgi:hypothetical protein